MILYCILHTETLSDFPAKYIDNRICTMKTLCTQNIQCQLYNYCSQRESELTQEGTTPQ